jgi:hypothetical protein
MPVSRLLVKGEKICYYNYRGRKRQRLAEVVRE